MSIVAKDSSMAARTNMGVYVEGEGRARWGEGGGVGGGRRVRGTEGVFACVVTY